MVKLPSQLHTMRFSAPRFPLDNVSVGIKAVEDVSKSPNNLRRAFHRVVTGDPAWYAHIWISKKKEKKDERASQVINLDRPRVHLVQSDQNPEQGMRST